jgi:transcriptional regulator with XRE-family HTH domain
MAEPKNAESVRLRVGARLRHKRLETGVSFEWLLHFVGLNKADIVRLEAGKREPTAAELMLFAQAYKVRVLWFFGDVRVIEPQYCHAESLDIFDKAAVDIRRVTRALIAIDDAHIRQDIIDLAEMMVWLQREKPFLKLVGGRLPPEQSL